MLVWRSESAEEEIKVKLLIKMHTLDGGNDDDYEREIVDCVGREKLNIQRKLTVE